MDAGEWKTSKVGPRTFLYVVSLSVILFFVFISNTKDWRFSEELSASHYVKWNWMLSEAPEKQPPDEAREGMMYLSEEELRTDLDNISVWSFTDPVNSKMYLPEEELRTDWDNISVRSFTDPVHSEMYLMDRKGIEFSLNDIIRVRIDMYDSYGKRRTVGGDFLRLWMEEPGLKAIVSGDVIDHNNGSYTGILRASWTGTASILCFVDRRREEIALLYRKYNQYDTLWNAYAQFASGAMKENTLCFTTPRPPHLYCNYTDHNGGLPYYCLHPNTPGFTCAMWWGVWSSRRIVPMTPQEILVFQGTFDKRNDLLPTQVKIRIAPGTDSHQVKLTQPSILCKDVPPAATWQKFSPSGFIFMDTWYPRLCSLGMPIAEATYSSCLANKTLWLSGDSTSIQFVIQLNNVIGLAPFIPRTHEPKRIYHRSRNYSVAWAAHGFPYFPGGNVQHRSSLIPPQAQFKYTANNSRDIFVLYLNIHLMLVHPRVFRQHVRIMAQETSTLLARAPNVTVAVRGPHAFYQHPYKEIYSYWGLLFRDIIHEEFRPLRDRVIFLDYWDMTVALAPIDFHPRPQIVQMMIQNMMAFVCRDTS